MSLSATTETFSYEFTDDLGNFFVLDMIATNSVSDPLVYTISSISGNVTPSGAIASSAVTGLSTYYSADNLLGYDPSAGYSPTTFWGGNGVAFATADGQRLEPYEFVPHAFMFRIPANTQALRLISRANRPCDLGLPADDRRLGFCVQSLTAQSEDGTVKITIEPHHAQLLEGFHRAEGAQHRWTQGDALLPNILLGDGTQDMLLTVKGCALPRYHLSSSREDRTDQKHLKGGIQTTRI